jgi:hypothetical protein
VLTFPPISVDLLLNRYSTLSVDIQHKIVEIQHLESLRRGQRQLITYLDIVDSTPQCHNITVNMDLLDDANSFLLGSR